MAVGIDPKVDFAFKRLFGRDRPVNHALLISLIHAVLSGPSRIRIESVQLLNPFHERDNLDDRLSIVDVKARDHEGRQFTIEMQIRLEPFLSERLLFYWAKLYPEPMGAGEDYEALRPTVVICFLDAVLWKHRPEQFHWRFGLHDRQHPAVVLSPHLEIHVIELPKFRRQLKEAKDSLEEWLFFLRHAETLDPAQAASDFKTPEIAQAMEELNMLSKDHMERERYEARLRVQRDESIRRRAPEIYRKEGIKEGIKEGVKLGEKKGVKLGEKKSIIAMIQLYESRLKLAVTDRKQLQTRTIKQLMTLVDQLAAKLYRR